MCNECCREFKGWCKSFTRTETALAVLEAVLLVLCVAFLIFLILHLIVCADPPLREDTESTYIIALDVSGTTGAYHRAESGSDVYYTTKSEPGHRIKPAQQTEPTTTTEHTLVTAECTWEPSKKTPAATHHYESDRQSTSPPTTKDEKVKIRPKPEPNIVSDVDDLSFADESDGEEAEDIYNGLALALVKMRPPRDITYGCILTAITDYWTLTAASCIESIEEVDSLDSFVMMEGYGGTRQGRTHAVADVQLHPQYAGTNRSFDLAALRSEDRLGGLAVELPTLVDYFLVTIGEQFNILGFGPYRTIPSGTSGRALRAVSVYTLPTRQCPAAGPAEDAWSPRHLMRGAPLSHAPCGAAPLCAGVLYARGAPCNYCAGAPLLRGTTLFGVMSDNQQCGVSCEPAPYVNVAVARDWLDFVLDSE